MRQFVGSMRDETSVRDLLVSVAPPRRARRPRLWTPRSWR
jgi:hypothetical protein